MLYRETIVVCSEINRNYINSLYGQNENLWMLNLVLHKLTTGVLKEW